MSMLAERRRKTKWVINPTKKPIWATDSNGIKFGKELMEKMGWSAGKGLGAKEQGIQEPLKVSYKNDTKGMGFKGNDDDWIEQQDEFNVLLNQLRNSDDSSVVKVSEEEKNAIKSLEEKSRQSRARVHYQKFTRGKDLSRYSKNDLACILGTNKIKKEKSKTEVVESEEKTDGHLVTSFGVTTINSGSIQDYFKKKWIADKVQSKNVPYVEKEKEEHSCDERPSFSRVFQGSLNLESEGFSKEEHKTGNGAFDGSELNEDSGERYEKRKKRKKKDTQTGEEEEPKSKRKKTSDEDDPVDEEMQNTLAGVANGEIETENLLGNENDCDSSRKRIKGKRKSKKDEGNDENEEINMIEVKKKKKERKEKPLENGHCDPKEVTSINCNLEADCPEGELVKKKRGKTGSEVFGECKMENIEEPNLEVSVGEVNDAVEGEDVLVAKRKRKKEKCKDHDGSVGVDECIGKNEDLGKVSDVCEGDTVEVGSKKKKKKKEREGDKMECCSSENGISSVITTEKCESGSTSNGNLELEQVKKKRKKKEKQEKKMEDLMTSSHEKCDGENNTSCTVELDEVKKKKKKKEKKDDKMECHSKESGVSTEVPLEKCDVGSDSNSTAELEQSSKKKKKKEDKTECSSKENGLSSEIPVKNCDNGSNSNKTAELEVKKKRKKKEKQEGDKMECCTNEGGPSNDNKCDSENNRNNMVGLDEVKKKRKKKEKQKRDKVECHGNENGLSSEIPVGKCDGESNSNSTTELEESSKKKKKKEKKTECSSNENEISSEVPLEKCDGGNNPNSTTELKVKKKKKKDKHETKEEDSGGSNINESRLEADEEAIEGPSETVEKKKKKKDKREKQKSKGESSVDHQEQESSGRQSMKAEVGSTKEKKTSESEGSKEGEEEVKGNEHNWGSKGNAEIGTTSGIDRVELISQRAAYEHVAGQHRYERVKEMFKCVNLDRFRGSNLKYLDGYGKSSRNNCETSAR